MARGIAFDYNGWLDADHSNDLASVWAQRYLRSIDAEDALTALQVESAYDAGFAAAVEAAEHGLAVAEA